MDAKYCGELDDLDYEIINILISDSRTPYLEIARQCNVSGGTVHVRMKKIEDLGIIKGSKLIVDYCKLGYDICCFVGVNLEKISLQQTVLNELRKINDIVELHTVTGEYSILAKVLCKNTNELNNILLSKIQTINGIQKTTMFLSLSQVQERNMHIDY